MESLNNYPFSVKDKSIEIFHDYLRNNYFNNFLAIVLILIFAIVFNIIYIIVESFIDKNDHYQRALEATLKYEYRKKLNKNGAHTAAVDLTLKADAESEKEEIYKRNSKIELTAWMYRNLQISFIHSLLCSLWLIKIFIIDSNRMILNDLLTYVSWDTYLLCAFSSGYFLYDFYDIYTNGNAKREWAICIHHWTVLVSFTYHMMNLLNVGYSVLALFMEFNSVFLHARKLLKFYSFKADSLIVRVNNVLNFVTFFLFRFGVLVAIIHGMITQGHRVSSNYLILLGSCTFIMIVINFILFKRLFVNSKKINN